MTVVITHARRRSKLSQLIDSAGGVSIKTALAQAETNLAALEPRAMSEIEDRIAELEAILAPDRPEDEQAALDLAYRAASGVIDAAAPFGLEDLCAAAARLCDLIDAACTDRPFDWRVLPVGARTLRMLISLPADATAERAELSAELERLVDRKLSRG